MKLMF